MLDWAAAHLPEPTPASSEEPSDALDESAAEPRPAESGYDGSEDEYHYRSETWVGS